MITRDQAQRTAQERITSLSIEWKGEGDSLILLESRTIERDWGWVFFYTSRLWLETRDIRHAIAGNAPFIIERNSGRLLVLGTARGVDHYLSRYEKYGDPHFEAGPEIRLRGCRREIDKLAATKLVRDRSGVGLLLARQIVEECVAGGSPRITVADPVAAGQLAEDLESLGFLVEQLPRNGNPDDKK